MIHIHGQVAEQQTRCAQDAVSIVTWRCNSSPGYQSCGARFLGEHQRDELAEVGPIPTLRTVCGTQSNVTVAEQAYATG